MTRVADLTGAELNYWVARANGIAAQDLEIRDVPRTDWKICVYTAPPIHGWMYKPQRVVAYSTDWDQGGPLIEKHRIMIFPEMGRWSSTLNGIPCVGDTALIAAMRALVASIYGDEVTP